MKHLIIKGRKGVSPIIGVLLMILIVLAMTGILYGSLKSLAESNGISHNAFSSEKRSQIRADNEEKSDESPLSIKRSSDSIKEFFKRHGAIVCAIAVFSTGLTLIVMIVLKIFSQRTLS